MEEEWGERSKYIPFCRWFHWFRTLFWCCWWKQVPLCHHRKSSHNVPALRRFEKKLLTASFGGDLCPMRALGAILAGEPKPGAFLCRHFRLEEHPVFVNLPFYRCNWCWLCTRSGSDRWQLCLSHTCDPGLNLLGNQKQPPDPLLSNSAWLKSFSML